MGGSYRLFVKFHFWFCLVPFLMLAEGWPTGLYRNKGINCIILNFKENFYTEAIGGVGGGAVWAQTVCVNISLL